MQAISFFTYLENRNVVIDLGAMFLRNTLGYPHDVPALLLLEFQVGVEDAKVELLQKREDVEADLVLEEFILQSFVTWIITSAFKQSAVLLRNGNE